MIQPPLDLTRSSAPRSGQSQSAQVALNLIRLRVRTRTCGRGRVGDRLAAAHPVLLMKDGGVQVVGFRVRKAIQGIHDEEIEITYANQSVPTSVLAQVGSVPGVLFLSLVALGSHDRPSV